MDPIWIGLVVILVVVALGVGYHLWRRHLEGGEEEDPERARVRQQVESDRKRDDFWGRL